jgi:hypothetical protein
MRLLLLILISFVIITSAASGYMLMLYPDGRLLQLHPDILQGSFFQNFYLPGILLLVLVCLPHIGAFICISKRTPKQYNWSTLSGTILAGWIIGQFIFLKVTHWLQFFYLAASLLIILISFQLKGKWAV